jgi:hypothetical protein
MADDARALRRTAAVGGRALDPPGDVLARPPAVARRVEEKHLAAIDRVGLDGDERLDGLRLGLGHVGEGDSPGAL